MRMTVAQAFLVLMSLATGAGNVSAQQAAAPPPSKFTMTTSAYSDGDWIPLQYTCGDPDGGLARRAMERPACGHRQFRSDFS